GERDSALLVHAVALENWQRMHRFCSRCGERTVIAAAGLTDRGAGAVTVEPDGDGVHQIGLAGAEAAASELFAVALDEAIGVVTAPRYLLPRYVAPAPGLPAVLRAAPNAVVQHAVPTALGENRRLVEGYADAWNRYVSTGRPVWTRSPEGTGLLAAFAGRSPLDVTTALRLGWH
ncbi:NADH pyrophosphatase zinc ribbon domain-containing protein, partial [Streptomyces spiramenti]|uniref:NADH pyrophosphatase zinc ribbon domain-containing protein n=1 Tax=Streptomyces spiramenti TaxID=2720606 RepID=UPI0023DD9E61